jgi:hypothetical protein
MKESSSRIVTMHGRGMYLKCWVSKRGLGLGFIHGLEERVCWVGDFVLYSVLNFGWAGGVGALGLSNVSDRLVAEEEIMKEE